jgi:LuxR family transcriptional regulator, maltose regulon positive regulatory protein
VADTPGFDTAVPLLETKHYAPRWRPGQVSRPRLTARLTDGATRALTLVSAPAGFGKTTLLAEWLANAAPELVVAWLSLDASDNDPTLFWSYVIAALQKVRPAVGETALVMLRAPQPPPIESVLTSLLNDVAALDADLTLILDDYHVIDAQPIHDGLAFVLDRLPPRMRLVIASRADPPLALARLRVRGELTELRAAHLRFTPAEAAAFLRAATGLDLAADDVAALEARTEGWIAGLQLAALSMQGRADVAAFIRDFAGDDRYVVDYLVEEVLGRQPERVRRFLLHTAILDRLTGSLCDAVTGEDDGAAMLEMLERGNLFVVPLDDTRRWYRYHHLFTDVLRVHAMAAEPDQVPLRHLRASAWYEGSGFRAEAIRHALAAGDFGRAAELVELAALAMLGNSQEDTLHRWLAALPDDVVRARPVLSAYYAFALFGRDTLDAAEARLKDAERWLVGPTPLESSAVSMSVADQAAFRSLPGTIAVARAYHAGALGDLAGTVRHAERALDLLPEEDDLWRGAASALLGIAHWTTGALEAAFGRVAESVTRLRRTSYTRFQIFGAPILADIRVAQGRLHEAARIYDQALRVASAPGEPVWGTADLYVGLAEIHHEWDDLETAARYLKESKALGEHAGLPQSRHRWFVAMARLREAEGNLTAALALLDEAERLYVPGPDPDLRPVGALKARVWLAQGNLAEALAWVRERRLTAADDLDYRHEFEHLTLARVLTAQCGREGDPRLCREAVALLDRLLSAAEAGERTGSVIAVLVLQTLAHQARGDIAGAHAALERALTLAEPEGYVRTFVDEGEAMRALLGHAAANGPGSAYTRRLLSAFGEPAPFPSTSLQAVSAELVEPLTRREVEILRLIAVGLRNQEIADRLCLSVSTVKRHIANAYGKLGVGHRTEALVRAKELKLL